MPGQQQRPTWAQLAALQKPRKETNSTPTAEDWRKKCDDLLGSRSSKNWAEDTESTVDETKRAKEKQRTESTGGSAQR